MQGRVKGVENVRSSKPKQRSGFLAEIWWSQLAAVTVPVKLQIVFCSKAPPGE